MMKGDEMSGLGIAMSSSTFASKLPAGTSFGQSSEKGWFTMKKLMFAAVAAVGMASLCGAVDSNIVG